MPPLVIAHRGASRDRPENTVAAFDEALRQGADGIELDLRLSADGIPVVHHDPTLLRLGGDPRAVERLDLAELRRVALGPSLDNRRPEQHISTLDEVLERYGGKTRLLLEIKAADPDGDPRRPVLLAERVASSLGGHEVRDSVMILSFDTAVLDVCAERAPELRRVLNVKAPPVMLPSLRRRLSTLAALSVDIRTLTPWFAAGLRRAGTPLLTFTSNTERHARRALRAGAAAVMTDRPAWLAAFVGRR